MSTEEGAISQLEYALHKEPYWLGVSNSACLLPEVEEIFYVVMNTWL